LRVQAPRILTTRLRQQRRLARAVSRKKRGSANRRKAAARLARHHVQVRDTRQHFLHQVSNQLVKTQAAGPVINACRRDGTGPHTRVGETSPNDAGTPVQTAPAA
jgi:hypothetical protein